MGGLFGGGPQEKAQKQSKKNTQYGVDELRRGQTEDAPHYEALLKQLTTLLGQGGTMTPEVIDMILSRSRDAAGNTAQSAYRQNAVKANQGGAGRDGSTNAQTRRISLGLGQTNADTTRNVLTGAATQNRSDILQLIQAFLPVMQSQRQSSRDIAQTYTGGAQSQAQIAASQPQDNGLGILGQGLGALLSIALAPATGGASVAAGAAGGGDSLGGWLGSIGSQG